jgi:hypothetical protein
MNIIFHPLEVKDKQDKAFITKLSLQDDGSFYCSLAFAEDLLLRIEPNKKGSEIKSIEKLPIRKVFGDDSVAITGGLQKTTSGDSAFAVVHKGSMPSALNSLFGKKWPHLDALNFNDFLMDNSGGMGFSLRHSIGQIQKGELQVRRSHEGGALVDVLLIGDNLFGLSGSEIWREPYLNTEKRYSLRADLLPNGQIHRDADDNFWLLGRENKLFRLKTHDIKAKPTFKKIAGPSFLLSVASSTDGWLYGVSGNQKTIFRIRLNKVTQEEEIQNLAEMENPVTSLCAADLNHGPFLMAATSNMEKTTLWRWDLKAEEDPEILVQPPEGRIFEELPNLNWIQHLQLRQISESQYQFWGSVAQKDDNRPCLASFTLD